MKGQLRFDEQSRHYSIARCDRCDRPTLWQPLRDFVPVCRLCRSRAARARRERPE